MYLEVLSDIEQSAVEKGIGILMDGIGLSNPAEYFLEAVLLREPEYFVLVLEEVFICFEKVSFRGCEICLG